MTTAWGIHPKCGILLEQSQNQTQADRCEVAMSITLQTTCSSLFRRFLNYWDNEFTRVSQGSITLVIETFAKLGLPLAVHELEGPTTCVDFLGFELDTLLMEIRLPQEKLRELQLLICEWVEKKTYKLKELQYLTGKLGHAAEVIHPGITYRRKCLRFKVEYIGHTTTSD